MVQKYFVHPSAVVEDGVEIGEGTRIWHFAHVRKGAKIGKNCNINSGVIIGCDGFGFLPDKNGEYQATPQIGNVIIEDNVDIGAATTIDRATLGSTIIRKGVKLDNQIQIAHNVEIGKNTVIAAQTGIAGSSKLGENCMIGGDVAIAGHIKIGNNVKIQGLSGVAGNLKDNAIVAGARAFNLSDFNRAYIHFRNLGKLNSRVNDLEKKLKN